MGFVFTANASLVPPNIDPNKLQFDPKSHRITPTSVVKNSLELLYCIQTRLFGTSNNKKIASELVLLFKVARIVLFVHEAYIYDDRTFITPKLVLMSEQQGFEHGQTTENQLNRGVIGMVEIWIHFGRVCRLYLHRNSCMQILLALEHMHAASEYFVSHLCRSISLGNLAYSTTMVRSDVVHCCL